MKFNVGADSTPAATEAPKTCPEGMHAKPAAAMPADHPPVPAGMGADACPVNDDARKVWTDVAEQASKAAPAKPQRAQLSTEREISSIPRSSHSQYTHNSEQAALPTPEEEQTDKWVYPSEQQFFNAMLRKNHKPRQADMRTIVPIHNAVNEKAWEDILMWEAGKGGDRCGGVRLTSFVGRPKERSPKAWIKTMFGYTPPFDRHDWIVDRCGTQIRYVIDFYTGKPDPNNPQKMAFYIDARPALDDWESIKTRFSRLWQ